MNIIEELDNYPQNKLAIILRHGDRDDIPSGEFGIDILLNEKGIERSILFGRQLKNKQINKIFSSPIPRCIQTSEMIIKGYGKEVELIKTIALGSPGLHISDDKIAGEYFLKYGVYKIHDHFVNDKDIPGIANKIILKQNMNSFIDSNTDGNGITLFITHDSLIAMYEFTLNGKIYNKDNWVQYLSGIIRPII